jgi:SAM-dependent methyltransferase
MTDVFAKGLYPICVATHDEGVRRLFDLATVLLLLDCHPGDRVLDLGAGPGFSSEMLARLGYDVWAIDPDIVALAHNRRRPSWDAARIAGRVEVVAGLAESLPFAAGAFDGVIGMNVLHHVATLDEAVREIARVLRPGRRAVFCEPGLDHLLEPETQRAMHEHGETDRPFDVIQLLERARRSGFREAMLSATLHAPLSLVRVEELNEFAGGRGPRPHLTPAGILQELRHKHAYAMLIREGLAAKTSRHPGDLSYQITVVPATLHAAAGETHYVEVTARNCGDTIWLAAPSTVGGFVTIGCRLLRDDGRLVSNVLGRTLLPHDVRPGSEVKATATLSVPADLVPGTYRLVVDLVNELRYWFADIGAYQPPSLALIVN